MVLLSLASCLEMIVRKRNVGMRTWRVGDLGLVATFEMVVGMRTWRVSDLGLVATLEMVVGMRTWRVGDLGLVATFEKRWHESLEGRVCFVSDLGLVATFVR